jgi:hypothetical protein
MLGNGTQRCIKEPANEPTLGQFPSMGLIYVSIVACLLKSRIVKPAQTTIARERLCKNVSIVTKYTCNNKRAVAGSFFCGVCTEAI